MIDVEVNKRFSRLVEYLGYADVNKNNKLDKSGFAQYIGVSAATIGQIISNQKGIGSKVLMALSAKNPDININWILTGEGDMINQKIEPVKIINESIKHPSGRTRSGKERMITKEMILPNVILDEQNGIPLIPIEAVAGFLVGVDNEGIIQKNCDHYIVPEFEEIGVEYLIRVSGNSMYPKYSNGDVLACKKIKDVLFFQWGKVYVLDSSQGALVKRIFEHVNPDLVICSSDNKDNFPQFAIPKSDIRSLSIVLGVIRIE